MQYITVAAAIILNEAQQLLVVRKQGSQTFMQVGGKLEPHELPERALLREIKEEIACDSVIEQFIGRFETDTANEPDCRLISYVYLVRLEQKVQRAAEIAETKWIDLKDQQTLLAPLTREIVIPWCNQYITLKT